ncbi:MAG: hypothetical protein WD557_11280 [Dehalococcoidia bacterium]
MRRRALIFTAVACLALGATACGDSEPDESERAIEAIDEICDDWRLKLDERGGFPLDDFDPENPSPEELRTVGDYFGSGELAAEEALTALRELSPPIEIEADVNALISALEFQGEAARMQAHAARAGDVEGFKATLVDAGDTKATVKTAADDLGATKCAF